QNGSNKCLVNIEGERHQIVQQGEDPKHYQSIVSDGSHGTKTKLPVRETDKNVKEYNQQRKSDRNNGVFPDISRNGRTHLLGTLLIGVGKLLQRHVAV